MNQHFHFIGICGIGMSGIAKILASQGYIVSGCDQLLDPQRTEELQSLGCLINHHQGLHCNQSQITTIVRSSDIPCNHPEIIQAQKNNIPVQHRAEILAMIMQSKIGLAVAGAHGKTTTSALLAHVLLQANTNPTVVVGGHMHNINSNAHAGTGNYIVVEADESDRSFLMLPKQYSIITNIDREHLNTYVDFEDIKKTFIQFANNVNDHGANIVCIDDPGIQEILPEINTPMISYGTNNSADFYIHNIVLGPDTSTFSVRLPSLSIEQFTLNMTGIHNILNATAVIALCSTLHISKKAINFGLETFKGVDRRFTFKGVSNDHGALIFDDYGHHPRELEVTFQVATRKSMGKVLVVFQPQRFSRTKHLWTEFVQTCSKASIDHLIITDIYPANEQPEPGITSQSLVSDIQKHNPKALVEYIPFDNSGASILHRLNTILKPKDLVLLQGAGKVNKLAEKLIRK